MFTETAEGIIELKDDGTYTKHSCRFHNVNGKIFKEDLQTKDMQPVPPSILLTVDAATGAIEGEQRGFVLDHEIKTPIHPTMGKRYVKVLEATLPVDFKQDITDPDGKVIGQEITYRMNKVGVLIKK